MTRGEKVGSLVGHENRVSCLGVSNDGISLCTGSWDSLVSCPVTTSPRMGHMILWYEVADTRIAQNLGILDLAGLTITRRHPGYDPVSAVLRSRLLIWLS